MGEDVEKFVDMVKNSDNIVFFGGAGVSTESGIPDFRSTDGLYNQQYDYPPETILSHTFFVHRPDEFYRFYKDKILVEGVEPNITHKKLAELEASGKLKAVITQNIDGLHQKAGSKRVYEVHGTVMKNHCVRCGAFYDENDVKRLIIEDEAKLGLKCEDLDFRTSGRRYGIPCCEKCGGIIKPDVVLYEEGLDEDTWAGAVRYITEADMLIVGGTSLVVYPAAGLIRYYKGNKLVLINKSETSYDSDADLVLHMGLGEVFSRL